MALWASMRIGKAGTVGRRTGGQNCCSLPSDRDLARGAPLRGATGRCHAPVCSGRCVHASRIFLKRSILASIFAISLG